LLKVVRADLQRALVKFTEEEELAVRDEVDFGPLLEVLLKYLRLHHAFLVE